MHTLSLGFLTLLGLFSAVPVVHAGEQEQIKAVIEKYVDGYKNAKPDLIQEVFHPSVRLLSVEDGKLDATEMQDWIKGLNERQIKGDIRKGTMSIKSIDVKDYAASVKLEMSFEKFDFTDYLSLLKLEGKWVIVGKIYHFHLR